MINIKDVGEAIGNVINVSPSILALDLPKIAKTISLADESYVVTTLPDATLNTGRVVIYQNAFYFSDGENWRRSYNSAASGKLWSAGANSMGTLGEPTLYYRNYFGPIVTKGVNWKAVAKNSQAWQSAAAINYDGVIWTWGQNGYGQLGQNHIKHTSSPVSIFSGATWSQVSCGWQVMIAIKSNDNTVWTWGRNQAGQLGDNTTVAKSSPVSVVGGFTWKQVAAGGLFVCSIKSDDTLWAWGSNVYGQLGDNSATNRSSPVSVVGGFTWKQVSAGGYYMAAIKSDDTIWTWGRNDYGQLGINNGSNYSSPMSVVGGFTWKQVSAGGYHCTAIKSDDTLWAWGRNLTGQLGNNSTVSTSSPVSVVGGFTWKQVSAGGYHTMAIKSDDTLWAWGNNSWGQLGTLVSDRSSPVQTVASVSYLSWSSVAAYGSISFAIDNNTGI